MSEGINESIQKALDIALMQFGIDNNIDIVLENINAPTDTSKPFLAGYLLPSPTETADLYFTDVRTGVYQIDINYASGLGSAPLNRMTDKLNAAFKPSAEFTRGNVCVQILNFSDERATVEGGWNTKPISITYQTYTERL